MKELHLLHFMSWDEVEDFKTGKNIRAVALCDEQGYFHAAINAMRDGDMGEKDDDGVYSRIWWGDYINNSDVKNVRFANQQEVALFLKHYPLAKLAKEHKKNYKELFVAIVYDKARTDVAWRDYRAPWWKRLWEKLFYKKLPF